MAADKDATGEDARRNYAVLLGQGISTGAANALTSVQLVLPFLYTTVGAPVFFAGLLVPIATVAKRLAQILVAPLIGVARAKRRLIAFANLTVAAAVILISLTFDVVGVYWLVPIFLSAVFVIGAANGLSGLAFQDLIGTVLTREQRERLLFTQSSFAGLIVVIVAAGSQVIFPPGTPGVAHQELIWLGIALFVLSAVMVLFVREPKKRAPRSETMARDARTHVTALRESFRRAPS